MNIHQLKASAESLTHGRLCCDQLRARTSLLAMLDATPKQPSPEERAALRAAIVEGLDLPESASDELILQAVADLLDQAAADKTGEALGIERKPAAVKLGVPEERSPYGGLAIYQAQKVRENNAVRARADARVLDTPAMAPGVVRLRAIAHDGLAYTRIAGCAHGAPSPSCESKYGPGGCYGACSIR
jgi:hypothetical protein